MNTDASPLRHRTPLLGAEVVRTRMESGASPHHRILPYARVCTGRGHGRCPWGHHHSFRTTPSSRRQDPTGQNGPERTPIGRYSGRCSEGGKDDVSGRIIGTPGIGEVLTAWGLHEALGRLQAEPGVVDAVNGPDGAFHALRLLLQVRVNVVASILAAQPVSCATVEIDAAEIPNVRVMEGRPLNDWATSVLDVQNESGEWVRRLAAGGAPIVGPLLTIARRTEGPLTLFDGMHRAAAWVAHARAERGYPITVNVVITKRRAPAFESASP
jgi:hypothetical protein